MRTLDDTDREILRLLFADARRPYSDLADRVDLSAPAVSDRVDRLQELGVIEGFTIEVDRDRLRPGLSVLVDVGVALDAVGEVRDALAAHDRVEHVFATADGRITFTAVVREGDVRGLLGEAVGLDAVEDLEVRVLADRDWSPSLEAAELAVDCVECGNTVTSEGEVAAVDGERHHFCCGSCRANFEERYERLAEGA